MLFMVLSIFSFAAQANMTVYPMVVGLNEKGEGSVRLISKSRDVQFVQTKVFKIISQGAPDEKEIEIKPGKGNDLVVMPPKSAIPG